jgi:hypothetical protein
MADQGDGGGDGCNSSVQEQARATVRRKIGATEGRSGITGRE